MKYISDLYPDTPVIRELWGNLRIRWFSRYRAFSADQERALARRLRFHYISKHRSRLNVAEIELSVLSSMGLSQRIQDKDGLRELEANAQEAHLKASSANLAFHHSKCTKKNLPGIVFVFQHG